MVSVSCLQADELLPAPPEAPKEVGNFQDGFSAALGYTGTDFDTALHDADGFPQLNSTVGHSLFELSVPHDRVIASMCSSEVAPTWGLATTVRCTVTVVVAPKGLC